MSGSIRAWWHRMIAGRRSAHEDRAIADEVLSHIQLHVDEQVAAGVRPAEARRHALVTLGGLTQVAGLCHDRARLPLVAELGHDLRLALRQLTRNRGFTAAAILTLALGIGATSAIFSVVKAVLLTPLPYPEPQRRVMLFSRWISFEKTSLADAEIIDYRAMARTLTAVAGWLTVQQNLTGDGEPARVGVGQVSANTFDVLGVRPLIGRVFTLDEDRPNGPPVAVIGYALWQSRYGADPAAVGRSIVINDVRVEVIGVMPPGFQLPTDFTEDRAEPTQLWRPAQIDERRLSRSHGYAAAALLAPGQTAATATDELRAIARRLTEQGAYPEAMQFSGFAVPFDDEIRGGVRPAMWLLTSGVACLLLISCANVANLLLVRGEARHREMAVRTALGAAPQRLVRQLLTEGALLAMVGALTGLPLAAGGLRALVALDSLSLPPLAPVQLDLMMVLLALVLGTATTMVFGLGPALQAPRISVTGALRDTGSNATAAPVRLRLRKLLVITEVALATVLLIGAGLMIRSLEALRRIDLGFDPAHVLTVRVALPEGRYATPTQVVDFYRVLAERARTLPGVAAAGVVRLLPLATTIGDWGLDVEGYEEAPGHNAKGDWQIATDGAFEAMGTRLIRGRWFTPADRTDSQPVAVVNETLARTYWRNMNEVVGGRIRMGSDPSRPWAAVVGVVADERHNGLTGVMKEKFYVPHSQWHIVTNGTLVRNAFVVVRTHGDPLSLAAPLRSAIRELDPDLPVGPPRAMTDVVSTSLATSRLTGFLLGIFAAIAVALAGVGIYGVIAYFVSRRTRELGIRLALGSDRLAVIQLVMRQGLALVAGGIACGVTASLAVTRLMQGLLFQVAPLDPLTFALVPAVLIGVAVLASAVPGIRVARLNPLTALRTE